MKIKWFGHSAFRLTSESGKVILTDPYESGCYNGALSYSNINIAPDIVTVSHNHADHNYTSALPGKPAIINKPGDYETAGIKITGLPTYHDTKQGKERGNNIIFVYEIDGLRIAHCGDLGHILSDKEITFLDKIDIIFIPVGGHFTIDATQATDIIQRIKPKIIIPMHYKTEALDFPIAGVDEFLQSKINIKRIPPPDVSITTNTLPLKMEIWILPYH